MDKKRHNFLPVILSFTTILCLGSEQTPLLGPGGVQFVENKGQVIDSENNIRPDILFTGEDGNTNIYLKKNGVSYIYSSGSKISNSSNHENNSVSQFQRIDMDFVGAQNNTVTYGEDELMGFRNYYYAHCPNGITNVKSFNKVIQKNIYPNTDIIYYGGKNGLKYDIVVNPGGNEKEIQLKYSGADKINLENNRLTIITAFGELVEWIPKVYQNIDGKIKNIRAEYVLDGSTVSFNIHEYQKNYPLIIDPWVTYFGGNGSESAFSVFPDLNDNLLVTGETNSPNFPVTTGAFQTLYGGGPKDVFIGKFDPLGQLLWTTYFGGSLTDVGYGVVTDNIGDVIVTGETNSTDFPSSTGAFQTTLSGGDDIFLIKLNGVSGGRIWTTYYGGTKSDQAYSIDVDVITNDVAITGTTLSADFPVTSGAYRTDPGTCGGLGCRSTFVSKFNSAGNPLWCTYYLGIDATEIAIDAGGDIAIVGHTGSAVIPVTPGVFQPVYGGARDAFVAKFDGAGSHLWATYIGGSDRDDGFGIDTDSKKNILVNGHTFSSDFPTSVGAFQTSKSGPASTDVFVIKLNPQGQRLWSTYLGGTDNEEGSGIAVDSRDHVFVFGDTYSLDFPVTSCAYQTANGGGAPGLAEDNFVTQFDSTGILLCSGYIGGNLHDETTSSPGRGNIKVKGSYLYIEGYTQGNYPVTPNAYQPTLGGSYDAFIAKLCTRTCGLFPAINIVVTASDTAICVGDSINFTSNISACDTAEIIWKWDFQGSLTAISTQKNPSGITYASPGTYPVKLVIESPCGSDSLIKLSYITVSSIPTASINGNTSICAGDSTTLTASGGGQYLWSTGSANTIITTSAATSVYSLSVESNGCTDTASVIIIYNPIPIAVITGDTLICSGDSVTLTASGGINYLWSTSAITNTIAISPAIPATYSLIAFNGGCTDTTTIDITVFPIPLAGIAGNTSICWGDSTILTASGGGQYLWNTGVTASTISTTPAMTVYSVTVTANGCSDTSSVTITVNPIPVALASGNTVICSGQTSILSASGGTSYLWSTGASSPIINVSPLIFTTYTLVAYNGICTDTNTINISVNPNPVAGINGNSAICEGDSTILTASGGGQYLWNTGSSDSSITVFSGSALYSVTVISSNGCKDSTSHSLTVNSLPTANAGEDDTICSGTEIVLLATGGNNYSWNDGQNTPSITVSPTLNTIYSVTVSNGNCYDHDEVAILVKDCQCGDIFIPNVFSPNGDGQNDILFATGNCIKSLDMTIYDRWGEKVFETSDLSIGWNGTNMKGILLNSGVFVYTAIITFTNDPETVIKKGNITLVK